MEKELEDLLKAYEEVEKCDLSDEIKKIVLQTVKARIFDLRTELSRVEKNMNIYHTK